MQKTVYYFTDISVVIAPTNDLLHSRAENDGLDLGLARINNSYDRRYVRVRIGQCKNP